MYLIPVGIIFLLIILAVIMMIRDISAERRRRKKAENPPPVTAWQSPAVTVITSTPPGKPESEAAEAMRQWTGKPDPDLRSWVSKIMKRG